MNADVPNRLRRTLIWLVTAGLAFAGLAIYVPVTSSSYAWIKVLHILAVISWMAGMLYLPRLFVYHCGAEIGSVQSETFKVMERRLLRGIINPAMVVAWVAGLWLAWKIHEFQGAWLHAKLAGVVILSGVHGYFAKAVADFARDQGRRVARHWRLMNEVPTLLMIVIVILVVVQPF